MAKITKDPVKIFAPSKIFTNAKNFIFSGDRVSEGTTSLIKNLLVLQPNKRLTAIEVLDSLSSIIAKFKIPALIEEDEQVVPNIDEDKTKDEEKNDKKEENPKLKSMLDFSKQISIEVSKFLFHIKFEFKS